MTQTRRAVVMTAPHQPLEVHEIPVPHLEPGAARLRVLYSEVCGTDVHLHHGRLSGIPYPIIPGHVSVGEIEELGGPISDVEGRPFRLGDRVTFLDVHETCGRCFHCLVTRQSTRCPHRKVYGITYPATEGLLGGWAEALWVKPGVHMLRLPESLDAESFIGGGCGLVTAMHAVERAAIHLGDSVAVLGAGPVGQSIVALAALSGADHVVAIGDPPSRLAFAQRMGATHTFDLGVPPDAREEAVRALTNGFGVDVVIEASGAPDAVSQALDLVRDGGRVVVCGHYSDNGDVRIHPHWQINRKHVELRGCWGSDFSHFHRALRVAAKHAPHVPWREMVGRAWGLDEANEALAAVERREVTKALIDPSLRQASRKVPLDRNPAASR
ncbi:MAG: zinc-binding dehydrogenase [Gemmatimonadaceae bacterium]|nr:zinc-binding dehydrogenase [Gemmatimonadaceae bacterium]